MEEFSIHANVNTHGRDVVFRVTMTLYDEHGEVQRPITWRGHDVLPRFDSLSDQAHVAMIHICKMLERCGSEGRVSATYDEGLWQLGSTDR
jgi:hypothetical protein